VKRDGITNLVQQKDEMGIFEQDISTNRAEELQGVVDAICLGVLFEVLLRW
jgi:hypothetical protein